MESFESNPLQEENLASFRRKNTLLIAILFSFIVSLTLIIAAFITFFVFNRDSRSPISNLAVDQFCSATESPFACIATLSSSQFNPLPFTDPIQVYTFSLQSAVHRLSRLHSIPHSNCSTSLRAASGHIREALDVIRVDPINETRVFEEREAMAAFILGAMEGMISCRESTALENVETLVDEIELLLRYCRDYLVHSDLVNRRFHFQVQILHEESSGNRILRLVADSSVFGLQYFVLVFLLILILLRCNFCYIGGCCRSLS